MLSAETRRGASPHQVKLERRIFALLTSAIGYELSTIRCFTLRAAVLEWDEPSAWAQIWALVSALELLSA